MKKLFFALILAFASCTGGEFSEVKNLVERRAPWLANNVVFRKSNAVPEQVSISTDNGKLIIEATGANAAAVGVNRYLKYFCHRQMSHCGDNLAPVENLPEITKPVIYKTSMPVRYALNYCTFNYSMSFYGWADWERELDWMALNGVNLMLVATGAEAVWQNTLRRLGYSDEQIARFIAGPAYTAWWLMGNIEGLGGPMPQSQIDSRAEMTRKIIARMRALGIEPVMPGFYGMVPANFGTKTGAITIDQGLWCGMVRPAILDPAGEDFARVAKIFYDETARLYGDDLRWFSADPFHEGGDVGEIDISEAGLEIQNSMQVNFPASTWVLQGWGGNPNPKLLKNLNKDFVLIQELFGENTDEWSRRKGYEKTPFVWGTVTNFGERPGLVGKLQRYADEVFRATQSGYKMRGVGILPEGILNNPVVYEFVLELPWSNERVDMSEWLNNYITARYGIADEDIAAAWEVFLQTVYSSDNGYTEGPPENILCATPALDLKRVSTWGSAAKRYDVGLFRRGVERMAAARKRMAGSETYLIDLIDLEGQVIAAEADSVYRQLVTAHRRGDKTALKHSAEEFLKLHDRLDDLLRRHPFYRLETYKTQALEAGNTPEERKNNLHNLMLLTTDWTDDPAGVELLRDYAYKHWSGLVKERYKKRWEDYFKTLY